MSPQSLKLAVGPRQKVMRAFLLQGVAGLTLLVVAANALRAQTAQILDSLGTWTVPLIVVFFITATALQALRFELTKDISVALGLTAYMSMLPLLGPVASSWIGVAAAILGRYLAMLQIGPNKIDMSDPLLEHIKALGLFGTFGVPVLLAGLVYERLGGVFGLAIPSDAASVARLVVANIVMLLANSLVMVRPGLAYGYTVKRIVQLYAIDLSIYLLTLPFAVTVTLAVVYIGWPALLALLFELIVAYAITRNMALAQTGSQQLLLRLASLTKIGKAISLTTTDNLLMTVYTECKKVLDTSLFSIALKDEKSGDLTLELFVANDEILPKRRIPAGEGLNAWVIEHEEPLLLGEESEESQFGITSFDDGVPSQSWMGVPMIARDRAIGAISLQSRKKNAFTRDDVLLLTAVANQAAVALDNAKLYEDLEDLTYALEERVQERTNELHETNVQLVAADRAKNEFLAKMSHELRTPLNSIIGFSSVLMQSAREELPPRLFKFLENIHAAGTHLLNLINDILDLSKIEAGKVELRLETFDPRDTVAAVERVMKAVASEARVTILSSVDGDVPMVRLDEGRLKQILFNLLSNAVKFSPEGEIVRLKVGFVDRAQSPIRVDSIRVEVIDHGVGIDPDEVTKIFDEFYQTDQGRRIRRGGTGLGLSLTRNFIELHHGTIDVKSAPGDGSTFTLYLPVDCENLTPTLPPLVPRRHSVGSQATT